MCSFHLLIRTVSDYDSCRNIKSENLELGACFLDHHIATANHIKANDEVNIPVFTETHQNTCPSNFGILLLLQREMMFLKCCNTHTRRYFTELEFIMVYSLYNKSQSNVINNIYNT